VAVFLLDGNSTEFSEIHDPIILYPGLPRSKFEVPKALLIGRLFAVIESDPAVFTTLARALGVPGLQILGPYNIKTLRIRSPSSYPRRDFLFLMVLPKKKPPGLEDGKCNPTECGGERPMSEGG
jgi:hypothetical protein